ncbi:MAG: ADP-ribosylation factor-like protein [Candidatus Hermodarchaeota archaeon]|nr:ADP-ribosylation factor-like protein [Candidatus Hermodarchaeota archaeon]
MIHNVLLLTRNGIKLYHRSYWAIEVDQPIVAEYIQSLRQIERDTGSDVLVPIFLDGMKFIHKYIDNDLILVLVADQQDKDEILQEKIENAVITMKKRYAKQLWDFKSTRNSEIFQNLGPILDEAIVSTLKVVLLGEGGVGKTTILKMLMSQRANLNHVATMAVYVEEMQTAKLGPYEIAVWDFPGQELLVPKWRDYLRGTDVVLMVTDSTLKNVMSTRKLLSIIQKWTDGALIWAIANKQDLKDALLPDTVARLLGVRTIGLVAIDPRNKDLLHKTLMGAAAEVVFPVAC